MCPLGLRSRSAFFFFSIEEEKKAVLTFSGALLLFVNPEGSLHFFFLIYGGHCRLRHWKKLVRGGAYLRTRQLLSPKGGSCSRSKQKKPKGNYEYSTKAACLERLIGKVPALPPPLQKRDAIGWPLGGGEQGACSVYCKNRQISSFLTIFSALRGQLIFRIGSS